MSGSGAGPESGAGAPRGVIPFFVRHPNAANLLMVLALVFGFYGLARINTQFFPTVETHRITVSVVWDGASAEDVAANILDVLEPEVRFLDGVDEVTSDAREGAGSILIEFVDGADMTKALSDVEQAVASVTTLPADSDAPIITLIQFYETVARIVLRGPFAEGALKTFARKVRDRMLEEGIDRVTFRGLRDGEIDVAVSPSDLRRLGLTVGDVAARIASNSRDLPSGDLDGALERQIRVLGEAETPAAIGKIEVASLPSGERILVRDVAVIKETVEEDAPQGLSNGEPAIELEVQRAANADTLVMAAVMERALEKARAELPASVEVIKYQVGADRVAERIGLLVKNGLSGLALVVLILLLFLNARIALWVAAGVPVALMTAIGIMWATGQTINMISLFALIMTLGVIVDDAIVVGEHTATRLSLGDDPEAAAIEGAGRMILPVIAAMLTTVAAFSPILLISDVIGQIIGALPLVAISVLVASLIECFFILPNHLSHSAAAGARGRISPVRMALVAVAFGGALLALTLSAPFATGLGALWLHAPLARGAAALGPATTPAILVLSLLIAYLLERRLTRIDAVAAEARGFRARFDRGFDWVRLRLVRPLAETAVSFRYATVAMCVGMFILAFGLLLGGRLPFVFFPSPEGETINATVTFQSGLPEPAAIEAVAAIEAALTDAQKALTGESGEKLVVASFVTLGQSGRNKNDNVAEITVELTSSEVRTIRTPAVVRAWRAAMPDLEGVKKVSIAEQRGGPPGRDLDIRLLGEDPAKLKAAALETQTALSGFPGVSGLDDDLPYGKPEIAMTLTPRGAVLGFTAESVATQIRDAVQGRVARRLPTQDEEILVRVRQDVPGDVGALRAMELRAPDGEFVPLTEVVSLSEQQGFSVILRRDGRTNVSVTADVDSAVTTNQIIQETLEKEGSIRDIAERYGVGYEFSGRAEERAAAFADLRLGAVIAVVAMYLIIAALFAHYVRPLAVLMIVPFGLVGTLLGHWVMGIPLTILSFIGLLGLAGILVNDSIILVSRFAERLAEGEEPREAAVGASLDRMRAVLLTSLSTILGLTPLLFERSLQAQFLLPMAVTIVFGIGVATLFVLFLTPSLLMIGVDAQRLLRWFRGETAPAQA